MKKYLATYLAVFSLLCSGLASCSDNDDDVTVETGPYAVISSFGLGNIRSAYPGFTSDGRDTTFVRTVTMEDFLFTINQVTGEIYNNDSLPFATNVTKVVTYLSAQGVPALYIDSIGEYVPYSSSDSVDFTMPRKFRVCSTDLKSYKDYTITVNVHQLNPDKMVWNEWDAVDGVEPVRAIEFDARMCLFGTKNGAPVVASTAIDGTPSWSISDLSGLPATVDLTTVQTFKGMLYVLSDGDLYSSSDAVAWSPVLKGNGLLSIVVASEDAGELVVAGESDFYSSADGTAFEADGTVPSGFPLRGVSIMSYPLNHNENIVRYMAIGYDTSAADARTRVWSRLSNEAEWVDYENAGSKFACPVLDGLSVVRYDNFLYALGGAGLVNGVEVGAFNSFYISKDNGITWKEPNDFYLRLPEELAGNNSPFAVAVDSNNFMWIITSGTGGAVRKCIINRLGFKK